jgi:hypothetical protein
MSAEDKKTVVVSLSVPPWGTLETALQVTGITKNWLLELVNTHAVRKRKHGTATQGRAVYCIADIVEYLNSSEEVSA